MKKVRLLQNGHGHISFQGGALCDRKSVFGRGFPDARLSGRLLLSCLLHVQGLTFSFWGADEGDKKSNSALPACLHLAHGKDYNPLAEKNFISGAGAGAGQPWGKFSVLDECNSSAPLQSNPWGFRWLSVLEYFRKLSLWYWSATCLVQLGWDRAEVLYWSAEEK